MLPFNKEGLIRRANKKFARRIAVDKASADRQYAIDYTAIISMEIVNAWVESHGYKIVFVKGCSGKLNPTDKLIELSGRLSLERQLHVLLHECGHLLIGMNESTRESKYPNGYRRIEESIDGRDVHHKLDVIEEEFDAWRRGIRLAERLCAFVDREEYNKTKARYLMSYVRWASQRGRVSDE